MSFQESINRFCLLGIARNSIRKSLVFALLTIFAFVMGCGPKKPDDLPKLFPVQLTIQQEGVPLAGATVGLRSKSGTTNYNAGGVTDENGKITLHTHGQYEGVPEGDYTVIVSKIDTIKEGPWDQIPKDMAKSRAFMEKNAAKLKQTSYSLVNKKYSVAKTSDLSISVAGKSVQETLDLGKPVRDRIKSPL